MECMESLNGVYGKLKCERELRRSWTIERDQLKKIRELENNF